VDQINLSKNDNRIVGAKAIAHLLGVAPATVYGWACSTDWYGSELMPIHRTINQRLYVHRDDLDRFKERIG
jgi:DNA-binding transcriptional regulator YdaS (Cro superfamily)